jgi:hypothetical protein
MSASIPGPVATTLFARGAAWLMRKAFAGRDACDACDACEMGLPGHRAAALPTPAAREHADLRQPLRALAATHGAMLARRGIALELLLPDDPLTVALVPADVSQLMAHIADMAAAVLPQGATLRVLARAEGRHAVINWREAAAGDNSGISTDRPRLSQTFETRGCATLTPRVHACQEIAARHGARIYSAPSALGDSCLTLRFPLHAVRPAHTSKAWL